MPLNIINIQHEFTKKIMLLTKSILLCFLSTIIHKGESNVILSTLQIKVKYFFNVRLYTY